MNLPVRGAKIPTRYVGIISGVHDIGT